ncbi:Retrovirus-related Pol polyprotein from transposon RE2, partial [Linum perenne]
MDLTTRRVLYRGRSKNGLYVVPMSLIRPPIVAHTASLPVWHQRLGHAHLENVKCVLRRYQISFPNKRIPSVCSGCCLGKMHKLPFHVSNYKADGPLGLICSDVWGPTPVFSVTNQRYCVLFYDHFSKYVWLYFARYRSDLLSIFIQFRSLVEKFFGRPIKSFRADWGGEYQGLSSYLAQHGILEQTSCPHTPE